MSSLRIGLSKTGMTVLRVSPWRRPRVSLVQEADFAAPIASAQQFREALQGVATGIDARSQQGSIVLADEWVHYFSVASPVNVSRLADCKAIAALRFQRLYDLDATEWQIEAAWSASHHFLACAVPRWLIEALDEWATARRLRIAGIVPQFVCAWNQWHARVAPDGWFGLVHADRITFSALQARRPVEADTLLIPADALGDVSWLAQQLQRNALMHARPAPTRLYLAGGAQQASVTSAPGSVEVVPLDLPALPAIAPSQRITLAMQGGR